MFAKMYRKRVDEVQGLIGKKHGASVRSAFDEQKFAKFLWGDIYYNRATRKFQKHSTPETPRSFVHYILEPFYKLISLTLTKDKSELKVMLKFELGQIDKHFKGCEYDLDIKHLLFLVLSRTFGESSQCLVDQMLNCFVPASQSNYVDLYYQGNVKNSIGKCDKKGPLCISILKHYYNEINGEFLSYARIISGTLKNGDQVRVLGEKFNPDEQEDMSV